MVSDLTTGLVRILTPEGTTAGAGFAVNGGFLIASCAHVVQYAGGAPGGSVRLRFHMTGEERIAYVEPEYWRAPEAEDVAILQLQETVPAGVEPLALGSSTGTRGHPFTTYGFPRGGPADGMWGYGTTGDMIAQTPTGPILQLTGSTEVTPGFSGAPVLDTVARRVIGMVTAITAPDEFGHLSQTSFITPIETLRRVCPVLQVSDVPPYRGLDAFMEQDAEFFHGRERFVERLLEHVRRHRFLAVLGPSGSGKSSLVQAGLVPRLRGEDMPSAREPDVIILRQYDDPLAAVEAAGLMRAAEVGLKAAAKEWQHRHAGHGRLVLILDQFEEVLTTSPSLTRQNFIRQVVEFLECPAHVLVIVVMRDDFYSRLAEEARDLISWVEQGGLVNVPRTLERDELLAIVKKPAQVVGLTFEEGLVEDILTDVTTSASTGTTGGQGTRSTILPLLEFGLTQLWEKRRDGYLTHDAYDKIGRVTGGLRQWADRAYYRLDPHLRSIARRTFMTLVRLGDENQGIPDSRMRRPFDALYTTDSDRGAVDEVVRQLTNDRLLVTAGQSVELIHDALLQEWGLLHGWIREDRRFLVWRQEIDPRVEAWVQTDRSNAQARDGDRLLRGRDLDEAERWLEEKSHDLSEGVRKFIQASAELRAREEEEQRKRQQLELEHAQELAEEQRRRAEEEHRRVIESERLRRISIAQALAAQAPREQDHVRHDERAALLARQAYLLNERSQGHALAQIDDALRAVLSQSYFGQVLSGHEGAVSSVAFSPDGQTLASAGRDGTIRLWNLQHSDIRPQVLSGHEDAVWSVAFSPDGQTLASAGRDGTIRLWNLQHPDTRPQVLPADHEDVVNSVAFSPDGQTLASGGWDGTICLWNLQHPDTRPQILSGHEDAVWSVAFSPDGQTLASGGRPGTIYLWNLQHPDVRPQVLSGHEDIVNSVAFSPDGQTLASAGRDGTIRLWNLQHPDTRPQILSGHVDVVNSVAFSPDGQTLASGGRPGTIYLWNLQHPDVRPQVLPAGHEDIVSSVAFSPDGQTLASAGRDGTIRVWNLQHPDTRPQVLPAGYGSGVWSVAFSPDGQTLASGGWDGTICLWDLQHPDTWPQVLPAGHGSAVNSLAFSPDGQVLASGGRPGTICLWDLQHSDIRPQVLPAGHEDVVNAVAFSPDGQTLASGGGDGTIRLWNLQHSDIRPQVLPAGHGSAVNSLAFSLDGQVLASGGGDGTVRLWLACTASLANIVCQKVRRNLTMMEWQRFVGVDIPYERTCPNLPSGEGAPPDAPA